MRPMVDEFQAAGRLWIRRAFSLEEIGRILIDCELGEKPGARLKLSPIIGEMLGVNGPLASALTLLGVDPWPVRLVAFNKTLESNWSVPWHQDRVIAVKQMLDAPGYSNWLEKGDFWHCEPPVSLLKRMVFVRVHLDPSDADNGALELAIGSHRHGVISAKEAQRTAARSAIEICEAQAGDVLIVHALTLHRSRSTRAEKARRALRADYAVRSDLDAPLEWSITNHSASAR